jgi:hypothetical protein
MDVETRNPATVDRNDGAPFAGNNLSAPSAVDNKGDGGPQHGALVNAPLAPLAEWRAQTVAAVMHRPDEAIRLIQDATWQQINKLPDDQRNEVFLAATTGKLAKCPIYNRIFRSVHEQLQAAAANPANSTTHSPSSVSTVASTPGLHNTNETVCSQATTTVSSASS